MARAVQRRSNPPYLLIIFVFLFLVATTFAVLLYLNLDKTSTQLRDEQQMSTRLASMQERNRAAVREMLRTADRGKSVVGQLLSDQDRLVQLVTGQPNETTETALAKADAVYGGDQPQTGLVNDLQAARLQIESLTQALQEGQQKQQDLLRELGQVQQAFEQATATYLADRQRLTEEMRQLNQKVETLQQQHEDAMDLAQANWNESAQGYEKQGAEFFQKVQEQSQQIAELEIRNNQLQEELDLLKGTEDQRKGPERQPDGRVAQVLNEENVAYLNIGAVDGVTPGLTFAVYPSSGIPQDGRSKATLRINRVNPNTSEAIILNEETTNPVLPGDLVANIAFDSLRTYTFLVEGQFDLFGSGNANEEGANEVEDLIRRFGGNIAEDLSVSTDFVVLGETPVQPPLPSETAPPQEWELYKQRKEAFDRYKDIERQALDMRVPILNTNRFMAFMGYEPTRAVR